MKKMKFVVETISKSSGRLGHLIHSETGGQKKTPLLIQTTKGGSIPYLSREVFEYVTKETQLLQMTLATINQMAESLSQFKGSFAEYAGYRDYPTILLIRDPCELMPQGGNDKDVVPLFTRHGKELLTQERYMELVKLFTPDIYQGLCDADTNMESSKKRMQKSVDRTEAFMNYCYEHHTKSDKLAKSTLFAPIVGGYSTYARTQSIKHAKETGASIIGGYVLEGFHNYGLTATAVPLEKLLHMVRHCINELETEKPRLMPGAYTPLVVLELVRLGVDLFDSSYAYCATVNFKALTFTFDLEQTENSPPATPFLDLTDEKLKDDFTPLLSNCKCLACRKHTRAYVHHLYKTKEILGPILLMVHNIHHYIEYFATIQRCIATDKLPALIQLLKYQRGQQQVDYCIYENKKVIAKTGIGKGFITSAAPAEAAETQ